MKTDEPINVIIYKDGRLDISTPENPTFTQKALFSTFKKGVAKGEFDGMRPGRYRFQFIKIGARKSKATLTIVDD